MGRAVRRLDNRVMYEALCDMVCAHEASDHNVCVLCVLFVVYAAPQRQELARRRAAERGVGVR